MPGDEEMTKVTPFIMQLLEAQSGGCTHDCCSCHGGCHDDACDCEDCDDDFSFPADEE